MGRAYRNCEAGIAGIRYRAHVRRALALSRIAAYNTVAAVAGRHDDADARAYEPVYLDTRADFWPAANHSGSNEYPRLRLTP